MAIYYCILHFYSCIVNLKSCAAINTNLFIHFIIIPECALPAMTASCPVCLAYLSKAKVANTLARTQFQILDKWIEA